VPYRSQQCRLSSTAGSKEKDSGKLFGSGFPVEEEVEEDGREQADEQGDDDGRDGRRKGPSCPAVVPRAGRHIVCWCMGCVLIVGLRSAEDKGVNRQEFGE
jgi:hypothetical protein